MKRNDLKRMSDMVGAANSSDKQPNATRYYKVKRSGEQKEISQKKFERKAEKASGDLHKPDEKQDRLVYLPTPSASYDDTGKTTKSQVVKKGKDKKIKKRWVKETFEPGKKERTYPKGGYLIGPEGK